MARRAVNRKVDEALRKLTQGKEESIRALVESLDAISEVDAKILRLNDERSKAIEAASAALSDARKAGWKAKELNDADLRVPKTLDLASSLGENESSGEEDDDEQTAETSNDEVRGTSEVPTP